MLTPQDTARVGALYEEKVRAHLAHASGPRLNQAEIEDIVSEAYLALLEGLDNGKAISYPSAYIDGAINNLVKEALRRKDRELLTPEPWNLLEKEQGERTWIW